MIRLTEILVSVVIIVEEKRFVYYVMQALGRSEK